MRTMNRLITIALLALPLAGACKKESSSENQKPVEDTGEKAQPEVPIDLTATLDIGAAITDPDDKRYQGMKAKVPAGATAEPALTGIHVKMGEKGYEFSKLLDPGFVAKEKGEAQKDELDEFVKFHVDTPTAVLWESTSKLVKGKKNFSFAAEVTVGDQQFKCFNKGYGSFNKSEAEALLKSCQSITK